jgi:hypothetical protein
MPTTYEKIATTTLGSANVQIIFNSIAATYTDLRVVITYSMAEGSLPILRFNGDSSTNYSRTILAGTGSAASSGRNTSATEIQASYSAPTNQVAFTTFDIFSYAGSTFKTVLCDYAQDANGSGNTVKVVGLWRNTDAITSITLRGFATVNFNTGTTATIYGILKA